MSEGKLAKTKYINCINEWLKLITEQTGIIHDYDCEFNTYRLIIIKNGQRLVASCDYEGSTKFCNFINNLWVYYIALGYRV